MCVTAFPPVEMMHEIQSQAVTEDTIIKPGVNGYWISDIYLQSNYPGRVSMPGMNGVLEVGHLQQPGLCTE